uniref:Uncharacterized protein n=1 Tax=Physcomitrium patens TaxID=3218 RepID=A0A2K1KQI7_PHYPA|nr:uncharacterized protein LOC112281143 [Physcomitrium patens]PNR56040.1 hypothetical protein PHYPA_006937 [Physcomitrium patens]|eukprot:XP_024373113.1 uncharacterized protein LOC112281143 [Physcomitrella patens]
MVSVVAAARRISSGLLGQESTKRWSWSDRPHTTTVPRSILPAIQNLLTGRPFRVTCSLSSERPSQRGISPDTNQTIKQSAQARRSSLQDVREFEVAEQDGMEDSKYLSGARPTATLQEFFEANAASGRVECSGRGCRLIYENTVQVVEQTSSLTHCGFKTISSHLLSDFFTLDTNSDLKEVFEAALQDSPWNPHIMSEFAGFTWDAMGDPDAAEKLYTQAIDALPDDPDVLASHALFLWHSDQ